MKGDVQVLPLWGADRAPLLGDSVSPPISGFWPPPGGVRVTLSTKAPEGKSAAATFQSFPDINDSAGFHASESVDVLIVLYGEIWLVQDDGVETKLQAGDVLIQNGTRHKWRNHGVDWPVMACVIFGTERPTPPSAASLASQG